MKNKINKQNQNITAFYCRGNQNQIEQQKEKLIEYAKKEDIGKYEFYIDNGFSGRTLERPALKRLIANIEKGAIYAVVVAWYHNLSRDCFLCMELETIFKKNNVDFVISQEPEYKIDQDQLERYEEIHQVFRKWGKENADLFLPCENITAGFTESELKLISEKLQSISSIDRKDETSETAKSIIQKITDLLDS